MGVEGDNDLLFEKNLGPVWNYILEMNIPYGVNNIVKSDMGTLVVYPPAEFKRLCSYNKTIFLQWYMAKAI